MTNIQNDKILLTMSNFYEMFAADHGVGGKFRDDVLVKEVWEWIDRELEAKEKQVREEFKKTIKKYIDRSQQLFSGTYSEYADELLKITSSKQR